MDRRHATFLAHKLVYRARSLAALPAKKRIVRRLVAQSGGVLPVSQFVFRCSCGSRACSPYIGAAFEELKEFRKTSHGFLTGFFKTTAAVTDLRRYAIPEDYERAVAKATNGYYLRQGKKSRRLGYVCRPIPLGSHGVSVHDILKSKPHRARGPVFQAFEDKPLSGDDDTRPFTPPVCPEHWRIEWGVFHPDSPRMKAFATIQRTGNFVSLLHMMAHAEVLPLGGMKLLQLDLMRWLIERREPYLEGIDFLLNGAIEHGVGGMADWRKRVQQPPALLQFDTPVADLMPRDFNSREYLALNPDVRHSGMNPRRHFLWHGWLEGRRYKAHAPSNPS